MIQCRRLGYAVAIGIVVIGLSSFAGGGGQAMAQAKTEPKPGPAAKQAQPPYVGRWVVSSMADCKGQVRGTQGLLVYTAQEFYGYESRCKIQRSVAKGAGFELTLRCRAEGETSTDKETVEVRDGKLRRTADVEGKPHTFTYLRCP